MEFYLISIADFPPVGWLSNHAGEDAWDVRDAPVGSYGPF